MPLTAWIFCLWMMFLTSAISADPVNPFPFLTRWMPSVFFVLTILALFVLALSLLVAWKDYRKLSYLFKGGTEITGKILSIDFENKYAGRVQYEYQFQQRTIRSNGIFSLRQCKKDSEPACRPGNNVIRQPGRPIPLLYSRPVSESTI